VMTDKKTIMDMKATLRKERNRLQVQINRLEYDRKQFREDKMVLKTLMPEERAKRIQALKIVKNRLDEKVSKVNEECKRLKINEGFLKSSELELIEKWKNLGEKSDDSFITEMDIDDPINESFNRGQGGHMEDRMDLVEELNFAGNDLPQK